MQDVSLKGEKETGTTAITVYYRSDDGQQVLFFSHVQGRGAKQGTE